MSQLLTTPFSAFEGRVVFHCRHISRQSVIVARAMRENIENLPDDPVKHYDLDIDEIVTLLTSTHDIHFNFRGDEGVMLQELRNFWSDYSKTPHTGRQTAELVVDWAIHTSETVFSEWIQAVNAALQPVRKPEQLPGVALTDEEKAEVQNPDSPLVLEGANSVTSKESRRNSS